MRVALKECEWEQAGEDLVVVFDAREAITLSDPDGQVAALLSELRRAPQTAAELSTALGGHGFDVSEEDVGQGLSGLDSLGLVESADGRSLGDPGEDERQFSNLSFYGSYAALNRHRAGFQRSMREAHILVLGVGGGGSSLVQCLAGLGVGEMTLVDQDRVESRNFARQFLYRHADLGLSKAERAAAWVRDYDPNIKVNAVDRWISAPEDLADLVQGIDLIAGGLDGHPHANLWANESAVRAGVPYVLGGANRTQVMYLSVDPGRTPCLACDYEDRPIGDGSEAIAYRLVENMKLSNPLTGPMAMQVGSLLAFEAQRYLTGYEPPRAAGFRVTLDLRKGLLPEWQALPANPDCEVCRLAPPRGGAGR
ncbi:HesA/MoeB/ThiF family protein [Nonomuraea sp. LPB2021202275-12-8]|uniref:HesA/MoeB/ThiF family protein n=1 Tax=Nonomuraea sp. LPB2021202275-12-8 TaxID=3120159 RepID=UPI00300C6296